MTGLYLSERLMPGYSAIVRKDLRLSPGDGFEGLHSCPAWF
jgi:hypothetical protein